MKEFYEYTLTGRIKGVANTDGLSAIFLYRNYELTEVQCYLTMMDLRHQPLITRAKLESVKRK